jgi:hypothetical protein
MPSFNSENHSLRDRFEGENRPFDSADLSGGISHPQADEASANSKENPIAEQDLLMEQILENINTTPIGQVLKKIATLPEVRKEKVLDVRQQLSKGKYRLNERLDIALDRVLEDLTS